MNLAYETQKAAYEALKTHYDQIANLDTNQLVFDSSNPEYQRLRSSRIDAQVEQAQLLARRNVLEARIVQVEADIRSLQERVSVAQVEADQVNQALDLAKSTYLALSQKRTDLQIEIANSQNVLAQVIAPAYPIYEKVAPKRGLITVVAVVLGLLLAVLWAFLAEAMVPRAEPIGPAA
ncbi:MAG: hypothetical protein IVW51_19045 [Thermaceae bacterium]|nr:hypothetical protein [Thermaceae bacterium]